MPLVSKIQILHPTVVRFTHGVNGPPLHHIAQAREVKMPSGSPTVILAPEALCGVSVGNKWRRLTHWHRLDKPIAPKDVVCYTCMVRAILTGLAVEQVATVTI